MPTIAPLYPLRDTTATGGNGVVTTTAGLATKHSPSPPRKSHSLTVFDASGPILERDNTLPIPLADCSGMERLYTSLGDRKIAVREREVLLGQWKQHGAAGARWLIERVKLESDTERRAEAAAALAEMGVAALGEILNSLLRQSSTTDSNSAEVLLGALRILLDNEVRIPAFGPIPLLRKFMRSPNVGLRQQVYEILAAIGTREAQAELRSALQYETDASLRSAITLLIV